MPTDLNGWYIPAPSIDWTINDFVEIASQVPLGEGDGRIYGFVPYPRCSVDCPPSIMPITHRPQIPVFDLLSDRQECIGEASQQRHADPQPPCWSHGHFHEGREQAEGPPRKGLALPPPASVHLDPPWSLPMFAFGWPTGVGPP